MARIGFITVVNTDLRSDGNPVFSEIKPEDLNLAESMGYRVWEPSKQPIEARGIQQKPQNTVDFTKLQERIDVMLDLGYKPDLKEIGKLSDVEFAQQIEMLKASEQEEPVVETQEQTPTRGKKKNALQGVQD